MKRLCIWVLFLLSGLLTLQAQESGPHSPRILGLSCSGKDTHLTSLDVSGCTSLNEVWNIDVDTLRIHGESMDDFTIWSSGSDAGYFCAIDVLDAAGCITLRNITCRNRQGKDCGAVRDLNLHGCTSLETVSVTGVLSLRSVDVSGCTALTSLVFGRGLESVNASGCTALTSLRCGCDSLDVSGCTALMSLTCRGGRSIDVSGCTALTSLDCKYNQLSSLDVSGYTSLTSLDCSGSYYDYGQLSSIDVSGCTSLTSLDCRYNQLSSLDVSGCTSLTSLDCRYNQLSSLDVSGCTALTSLNCSSNRIPLSMLYKTYTEHSSWSVFSAGGQSDSIIVWLDRSLDLSSERILGQTLSMLSLRDAYGESVSSDSWTENGFVFQFHKLGKYQLCLFNEGIGSGAAFTWHVSVKEAPRYTVQVASNNTYGSVSQTGNGTYEEGLQVTITATPKDGCRFVNWTRKDGSVFATEAVHTFTVTENMELTANFEKVYTVQLASNNPEWGTVTGSGIYKAGTEITVSARPKEGYRFVNWTKKDGTEWGWYGSIGFSVREDLELTANFKEVLRYTVRVVSNNSEWGTATGGGGLYEPGTGVTIRATPNEGYRFVNWTREDGTVISTKSEYVVTVIKDMELTANFEKLSPTETFTVSLSSNNPNWGIVSLIGDGTCERGEVITIIATPMTGCRFVNWTKQDGSVFTTEAVHAFAVIKNLELTANFEKISEEVEIFRVVLAANNNAYGSVSQTGNGTYEEGSQVTITAKPNNGYRFVNWTRKNGTVFATEAVHTFTVTENMELTANFEKIPEEVESFTVVLAANNDAYGSVSQTGNGTYEEGSQVTITATPNAGYRFVNWTRKNGTVFATEAVHTFTVTENVELTANFEKIPEEVESFTVVLAANNNAYGSVSQSGNGTYEEGSQVTITAMPNNGYRFVNWMRKNGSVFATEAVHTFTATENLELTANFEKIPEEVESFTVVLAVNNNAYGRVSQTGNGTYEEGSQVAITATPNNGYRFVNWTRKNGSVFATEAVHTFTVTENVELTANFEKIPDVSNESREEDGFYVYVQDHTIHLSAERGVVRVYNAAGGCVYSGQSTAIPVQNSGLYIVRIGECAYKAMVR